MQNIYSKYIEKYQNNMDKCNDKWVELFNVRNFYREKRLNHRIANKCILGVFPSLILFLIAAILAGKDILQPVYMRYAIVLGFVLSFFVFEPLLNMRNLKKLEGYKHLIEGKTKTEVLIDDFNNYFERIKHECMHRIFRDLKEYYSKENEKYSNIDKSLNEFSEHYNISVELKKYSNEQINEMKENKLELLKKYEMKEAEYNEKNKEVSIIKYFDSFFKKDWMQKSMLLMMAGLCLMLYWNIPFALYDKNSVSEAELILNMAIPFVGCFVVSFLYGCLIRKVQRDAFKQINDSLLNKIDIKKSNEDLLNKISTEKINIRIEMINIQKSIDLIDISLEQNEKLCI